MYRGTTPTHVFTVGQDLSEAEVLYLTYTQGKIVVEKTKSDCTITETTIEVTLTQAETLSFAKSRGAVQVQIRARFADGKAVASNSMTVPVEDILKDGEI